MTAEKKRVLLLLPTSSYRNEDFLEAAKKLDIEVIEVANYCHQLAPMWGLGVIQAVAFDQPEDAAKQVLAVLKRKAGRKPDAVLAVDDSGLDLAALLRRHLGLPGNSPEAVLATRDKLVFRRMLQGAGFNCPRFHHLESSVDVLARGAPLPFPVVIKARQLSASRGVIRADTPADYREAVQWVRDIQGRADRASTALGLIVESFIPGREYALEAILRDGRLSKLALFDKPDPLNGPYFEETLYVTPSRLAQATQDEIVRTVERACALAGLNSGPVHAEMRVNDEGVWLLEIAARTIGGLCGRVLRHALGMSLEEFVLRDALGLPVPELQADKKATGVMMIPVPRSGIFRGVAGIKAALAVDNIDDIQITAQPGQIIAPPPDGSSYLGFVFAQAASPEAVEASLRSAHRRLVFGIQREIPVDERT